VPTIPHQGTLNRLHAVLNRPERPKNHKRSTAGARGAEVKHLHRIIELQQGWGGVGRECTSVTDTLGRRWIGKVKRLRVVHAEGVHCKCSQGNHGIFHSRRPPLTGGAPAGVVLARAGVRLVHAPKTRPNLPTTTHTARMKQYECQSAVPMAAHHAHVSKTIDKPGEEQPRFNVWSEAQ